MATVLIVEDNELNMELTNSILESHGHKTIRATDGSAFLKLVAERRPDLIIMDIQLPEWSGLELTRSLKAIRHLRHIPVIAVTAFAVTYGEAEVRDAGCDAYLTKPISIPEFLAVVEAHLVAADGAG